MDLASAAFFADPYPAYRRLVAAGAPVYDAASGSWIVAGYADVEAVLRDPRLSKQYQRDSPTPFETSVLFRDLPDHARSRAVLNQAFAGAVMQGIEERVRALADHRIEQMLAQRQADFVAAFAVPFPIDAIAELLGIPGGHRERMHAWSSELIVEEDVPQQERDRRQYAAICAMEAFFRELIAEADPAGRPGLIAALRQPTPKGDRMTPEEVLGNCILLLVAGHETTVNLLGNGMLLLLERPALLAQLRLQPELLPGFLEEALRYEAPVQRGTFRVAMEAVEYGGVRIEAGQRVTALIGAANRDPSVFPDPDRFDPARSPNRHLSFGLGPHRCVGAMLARIEARIAFTRLLELLPELRLQDTRPARGWVQGMTRLLGRAQPLPSRWRHHGVTRSLRRLDIAY